MKSLEPILIFVSVLVLPFAFFIAFFVAPTIVLASHPRVELLTADHFAVLAGSAISDTGTSTIIGDVGLSPTGGTAITGLTCAELTGTIYDTNAGYAGGGGGSTACLVTDAGLLTTAKNDLSSAYNDAAGRPTTSTIATELGGTTLTDGTYDSGSGTFEIAAGTTLTLDGEGNADAVFIFKMATTLTTGSSSQVVLVNGAQACNVYWQVGSSATLGTTTTLEGNILAFTSITDNGNSTIHGRLLANNAAVTLNNSSVTAQTCLVPSPVPSPIPTPIPTPVPSPIPTPIPTPVPSPIPTPIPTPTPSATPGSTPGPSPSPSSVASSTADSFSLSIGGTSFVGSPCISPQITTTPIIIESRRVSPTSIFISWGPFTEIDTFNVQYGTENGTWLYNTNVTGFSTIINDLSPYQPVWIQVAARNNCAVGTYGDLRFVGGPKLPNTGTSP